MNGFALPRQILYTALFLISPVVISPNYSVHAGVGRTHVSAPAAPIELASDTAVYRIKEAAPAADDTGRNARDRDGMTMTPLDQSNDPDDVKITQKIRKALVADDALSTTAKNVKIITVHGKVILRGPVTNAQEKKKVARTAQKFTKQRVLNELEVAAQ